MIISILVANLVTNFQDLVAKVKKNLVALVPVLGAISRPGGCVLTFIRWLPPQTDIIVLVIPCCFTMTVLFTGSSEYNQNELISHYRK